MDAERLTAEAAEERRTFQNVRGEYVWTFVCLAGGADGEGVGGGFRILRNGDLFAAWDGADAAAALRAFQGLTGRWAVPAAATAIA